MQTAAIIVFILSYGAAGYLAWQQRNPIYPIALLSGHISALVLPLWTLLYSGSGGIHFSTIQAALTHPPSFVVILTSSWHYPLPALCVLYLYLTRWWFPGGITGVLTYFIFFLYHLLIELIGLRLNLWAYESIHLPLGVSSRLVAAVMAGLISYAFLYALLESYRYALLSMLLAVTPILLLLSLLIHGLLGAPLWIALALDGVPWAIGLGTASALALLFWAITIVTGGISRIE